MSASGRLCCKSPKMPCDKFPAGSRNKPQSPIDIASSALPKSPASSSLGDMVPRMLIRKQRLQRGNFVIGDAKRLLQHNRHLAADPERPLSCRYRVLSRLWQGHTQRFRFLSARPHSARRLPAIGEVRKHLPQRALEHLHVLGRQAVDRFVFKLERDRDQTRDQRAALGRERHHHLAA